MHNYSTRSSSTNVVVPRMKGPECNTFFIPELMNGIYFLIPSNVPTIIINLKGQ